MGLGSGRRVAWNWVDILVQTPYDYLSASIFRRMRLEVLCGGRGAFDGQAALAIWF